MITINIQIIVDLHYGLNDCENPLNNTGDPLKVLSPSLIGFYFPYWHLFILRCTLILRLCVLLV